MFPLSAAATEPQPGTAEPAGRQALNLVRSRAPRQSGPADFVNVFGRLGEFGPRKITVPAAVIAAGGAKQSRPSQGWIASSASPPRN